MKLVLGLGNPGRAYEGTRHNVGFDVADELARRHDARFRRGWLTSVSTAQVPISGQATLLAKPQTFMNRSGSALGPLMRRKGLAPSDLIVVLDDVELETGQIRIRKGGGAGGHNGLRSVIDSLGTEDFVRLRFGVGPRPPQVDLVNYVLGRFRAGEREVVGPAVQRAADAVESIISDGADRAMNAFNVR